MKKLSFLIIGLVSFLSISLNAQTCVTIGNIDSTGNYIITAPTTQLDSIFLNQTIFEDWVPSNYEITYDSITVLYHLQAKGNGVGPNLGHIAALRVYISQSSGVFTHGSAPPPIGVAASETCTGAPCSSCKFLPGGGCFCGSSTEGHCNHTISK